MSIGSRSARIAATSFRSRVKQVLRSSTSRGRFFTTFEVRPDLRVQSTGALSASTFEVIDPATGKFLVQDVPDMDGKDTDAAIARANAAFSPWRHRPAKARAELLMAWHNAVLAESEYLAQLMTAEQGKPLAEARGEVGYGSSFISWFAEEAKRVYGDVVPAGVSHQRILITHQPVGVCSLITPWNFPLAMITRKAGAALAAGCTAVIKPAEDTPLTAEALVRLAHNVGIPEDVLQLVTCSRDNVASVGTSLTTHPDVRKVSFTGSTAVGKRLTNAAAHTMKRVSMELGGNAPFIVFADANVDAAVQGAMASKFRNSGQTCVCANRFFVHDAVYDEFLEKFTTATQALVLGHGSVEGTTQGPLINAAALEKVRGLVADAVAQGATIVTGGESADTDPKLTANFFQPTIVTNVEDHMSIVCDEIFGPVAPVMRFDNDDEVIARANATRAGLAAYFYANDLRRVWQVADQLEYGMVGVNSGVISTEVAPFGGVKESGVGREGSKYGIHEYLHTKYMLIDLGV